MLVEENQVPEPQNQDSGQNINKILVGIIIAAGIIGAFFGLSTMGIFGSLACALVFVIASLPFVVFVYVIYGIGKAVSRLSRKISKGSK